MSIFLLTYYVFGNLLLPNSDFSILPDLPAMYQHCKETEDIDMTPFDFITDHLLNIDCLFDAHDNDDEQKSHQPFPLHEQTFQIQYCLIIAVPSIIYGEKNNVIPVFKNILPTFKERVPKSNYLENILKPPILA